MALFGNKDEKAAATEALRAEVDRLDALPLAMLAAEVMQKGFGPGTRGADEQETVTIDGASIHAGVTVRQLADGLSPTRQAGGGADPALAQRFDKLVAEAVQQLEHASLIRTQIHMGSSYFDYALTRLGRQALEQNTVARALGASS